MTPRFCYMIARPHGECWVEADDPEVAEAILREHYGRSVEIECVRNRDDRPIRAETLPGDRCYLAADATWRHDDGAPMLDMGARMLMAFGASYQEALDYNVADAHGDGAAKRAVANAVDARNKVAARKQLLEETANKARLLGEQERVRGFSTNSLEYVTRDLLPWNHDKATTEERAIVLKAYKGD